MYLGVFRLAGLQREKMTPKERQAIRAEILDAAHSAEGGSKFVVEGARVVCTSMVEGQEDFEGEDFSDYGSESLMEKLSDEERAENLATVNEAFERKNAGRNAYLHNPLNRSSGVNEGREERASRRDFRQAIGNEDVADGGFFNLFFNGGRLLDHMDIKFSPFFGEGLVDEEDEESSAVEKNKNKMVGNIRKGSGGASAAGATRIGGALISNAVLNPVKVKAINKTKAAILEALSEEEPRGKCKYSKDNKCLPEIEDLMWKDTDGYVRLATGQQIAGSETLLKNDAYMFCHRGQGILYIESSGQHQQRMRDLLDEQAAARELDDDVNNPELRRVIFTTYGTVTVEFEVEYIDGSNYINVNIGGIITQVLLEEYVEIGEYGTPTDITRDASGITFSYSRSHFILRQQIATNNPNYTRNDRMTPRPRGIVVHSTAAPNPRLSRYVGPDDGILGYNPNHNHWNNVNQPYGMHAWVGKTRVGNVATYQQLPWDIRAWHASSGTRGSEYSAYHTLIGFEICEFYARGQTITDDHRAYFEAAYAESVQLCAFLCRRYSINPLDIEVLMDHWEAGTVTFVGNTSGDVSRPDGLDIGYFTIFGKTMNQFRRDVNNAL